MKKQLTYTFVEKKHETGVDAVALVCPNCGEYLDRVDLESYPCCPYCNYHFEINEQLESFLLRPSSMEWFKESFLNFPQ